MATFSLTPKRIAWLKHLEAHPGSSRPRGRIGYDCMKAGLTEWTCRVDGEIITESEARRRFGDQIWKQIAGFTGETLTEAGRKALAIERSYRRVEH